MKKKTAIALIIIVLSIFATVVAFAADFIGKGVVTGSVVNIRAQESTSSQILSQVRKGDILNVYSVGPQWAKVDANGDTGYIYRQYVDVRMDETSRSGSTISRDDNKALNLLVYAAKFQGVRYVYGGSSPSTGFDCSGFTKYVFGKFGYDLNRVASGQAGQGTYVSRDNLQAGDLVFFRCNGSKGISHVGIYCGDGNFIHSPKPGETVCYESLNSAYYSRNYVTARRILN